MLTKTDELYFLTQTNRLTVEQVAVIVRRSVKTLAYWRCEGIGPPYTRLGHRIYYDKQELEVWRKKQITS